MRRSVKICFTIELCLFTVNNIVEVARETYGSTYTLILRRSHGRDSRIQRSTIYLVLHYLKESRDLYVYGYGYCVMRSESEAVNNE
jgi:hypothetical protein